MFEFHAFALAISVAFHDEDSALEMIDLLQWPAMVATLAAGWLVASKQRRRRNQGFLLFLVSNLLWLVWGFPAHAYALIFLQFGLAVSNIRGMVKHRTTAEAD